MNWEDSLTVFAVPGRQVALLTKEQGDEILEAIKNKPIKSSEEKERISLEVKELFTKPEWLKND